MRTRPFHSAGAHRSLAGADKLKHAAKTLQVPGYRVVRELGRGGMATVYLAVQESLNRDVALKVLSSLLVSDPAFCELFLTEGKTIARMTHHNVVTIHDVGRFESTYYMAMEFLPGGSLAQRIRGKGLGAEESLRIVEAVASALRYAHGENFLHRDVKPANVLFRKDETPVLTDFGIAKAMDTHTEFTRMGWTLGTPEYMSPEQALGKEMDQRSDLYSLGAIFYEMLTGAKRAVHMDSLGALVNAPIPALPADLAYLQPILNRLLAPNRRDRFASADDLLHALLGTKRVLRPLVDGSPTQPTVPLHASEPTQETPAQGRFYKIFHFVTRRPLWSGAATALGLIIMFLIARTMFSTEPEIIFSPEAQHSAPNGLTEQEQAKIVRLLRNASAHYRIGRYCEPPGSSAYDVYQMVLEIDPDNAEARDAVRELECPQHAEGQAG